MDRLVGHDAYGRALDAAEADHDVLREAGVDLEELPVVQDAGDHAVHVIGLVGRVRNEPVELGIHVRDLTGRLVVAAPAHGRAHPGPPQHRRVLKVVGRQVGQQLAGEAEAVILVLGLVVGDARLDVVGVGAAELLEADFLPGHGLDHVGPRDEHVRGALDHQGEVGDRGRVDGTAGARAHDQRDLRDHARGDHVTVKDLGEQAERDHALLDPRPAAVVDADHRAPGLQRVVHHLDDLLAVDLAERPAEHGEVLAEHADRPAVDGAVAGDDAVAVGPVGRHVEVGGAVPGQLVELGERAGVEQPVDPLPRRHLAPRVLPLDGSLGSGVDRVVPAPLQVGYLARGRVRGILAGLAGGRRGVVLGSGGMRRAGQRGFGGHAGQVRPEPGPDGERAAPGYRGAASGWSGWSGWPG